MKPRLRNKNARSLATAARRARTRRKPSVARQVERRSLGERPTVLTVLVPVDLPEFSSAALDYAGLMAGRMGASVLLLHVISRSYAGGLRDSWSSQSSERAARRDILRKLSRIAAMTRLQRISPVQVRFLVREGIPQYEILRLAQEQKVGLIVLERHSRGPLSRMIFGSTTGLVVDHAPCPVVVVPEHEQLPAEW